jgi:hypothetical protein
MRTWQIEEDGSGREVVGFEVRWEDVPGFEVRVTVVGDAGLMNFAPGLAIRAVNGVSGPNIPPGGCEPV